MTTEYLPPRVAAAEIAARLGAMTLLDVRTPAEFESVHIPGSFNLPLDRLPEQASAIGRSIERPLVLVCRSGQRAQEAERALQGASVAALHVLEGGLSSWEASGLPVVRGRQRWSMERQVRIAAGALVLGSLIGSLRFPRLSLIAAGVGGGLLFSALTDTCGMAKLLGRLPYNRGCGGDIGAIVNDLAARASTAEPGNEWCPNTTPAAPGALEPQGGGIR